MLENFWRAVEQSKYSFHLKKWWKGYYEFLDCWVDPLRKEYIIDKLMFKPFHFVFNGAGFKNELNTKWEDGWQILEIILYAPLLRREILPTEIVIEPDIEDKEKLLKRSKWIKAALETLQIDYTLGFSGRRSFHFHIIVEPTITLPKDLPDGFSIKLFKQAIFNLIGYCAGFNDLDFDSAGIKSRKAIREFFSINEKTLNFKVPVDDLEVKEIAFPGYPETEWQGYKLWNPTNSQLNEIIEEVERIIEEKEKQQRIVEAIWKAKPRSKRTLGSRWRIERINHYLSVLEKHGRLMADSEIAQKHDNEWLARTHLCLLMLEEGWSDEDIVKTFSKATNFNERETKRQIAGCMKWLDKRKEVIL